MKTNRIEALSDALFAIVMTLLVLEIKVPQDIHDLGHLIPEFVSFFVSFVVVSIFWIGHHNQFIFIEKSDRVFLWLNILFFMFVSLIPFSAALLGQHGSEEISIVFYGTNLLIVGLILYFHWNYAVAKNLTTKLEVNFIKAVNRRILVGPIFYFLGILLSFINIYLALFCFLVPVMLQILPGKIDRGLRHD